MKSTDHNLNNPTSIGSLPLRRYLDNWKLPTVKNITREEYNLIQIKDPLTIYNIIDSQDHTIFFGDHKVPKDIIHCKYFMGIEYRERDTEYIIYLNNKDGLHGSDNLIEICGFKNIQHAIDALKMFNNIGSHNTTQMMVYNLLNNYIDKVISIHDFIVGIITLFNWKDTPEFQQMIQICITYGANHSDRDIPVLFREELHNMKGTMNNFLLDIYSDLYDIIVMYNFFKGDKYDIDKRSALSEEVDRICNVFYNA